MTEVYLPVIGFEGLYEVSNQGKVRSLPRKRAGQSYGGKILKTSLDHCTGYMLLVLHDSGRRQSSRVHVLVAEAFLGPRPKGLFVLHGPNGTSDNSAANLSYGTPAQNMADKRRDGTHTEGELIGNSKLTKEKVIEIYCSPEPGIRFAEKYGVTKGAISLIRSGKNWRSVTCSLPDRSLRSGDCQK